jgi:hypothetical protein
MGLKHLTVGFAICTVLLGVGSALVLLDEPGHGIPWLFGGSAIAALSVVSYWRTYGDR